MTDEARPFEDRDRAARQLEAIHAFMERAGRFSNLPGYSCILAGLLAIAGAALCGIMGLAFDDPAVDRVALGLVWGSVVALAGIQNIVLAKLSARRKGEPLVTNVAVTVVIASLPGFFMGAVFAAMCVMQDALPLLPGLWMLAYGSSLVGLGLFAGIHIHACGAGFLALGALSVLLLQGHGVLMMGLSFGGLHVLLGGWILAKHRD